MPLSGTPRADQVAGDDDQLGAPYLDALVAYSARRPARLHVPGHKGGPGADGGLRAALGEAALSLDIPALTHGIDAGDGGPTPFDRAQRLAAAAWGAARTWFLINGASQGNLAAGLALAQTGEEVVVQRNVHSSTIDALILSGLRPTFVVPSIDPELGIAHCPTPAALDEALARTPRAVAAWVVSPTYFGAVGDVAGFAAVAHARGLPLVVDEAWGAHLAFGAGLPRDALSCRADLVVSSTHKIVGSLTQSAMLHLGAGARIDPLLVDRGVTLVESTSPSSLLLGSLDAARRQAAVAGAGLLDDARRVLDAARASIRAIPGLDTVDERIVGRPGVFAFDPLRLVVDVRGIAASGYALAPILRELGDVNLELYAQNVLVAIFGLGEGATADAARLVGALAAAAGKVGLDRGTKPGFAAAPPWGELVMSPREAYLAPQEVVPAGAAAGRVAAESLATYPPGVPNVLPGERLTGATLDYVEATLELGGSVRGASDRRLRTVRVVAGRDL